MLSLLVDETADRYPGPSDQEMDRDSFRPVEFGPKEPYFCIEYDGHNEKSVNCPMRCRYHNVFHAVLKNADAHGAGKAALYMPVIRYGWYLTVPRLPGSAAFPPRGVSRKHSAHRRHPVADPGVLLCTHGLRQLPDLLVSLVHGWLVDLVIKKLFCLTAFQEAKLFVSVTLVPDPVSGGVLDMAFQTTVKEGRYLLLVFHGATPSQ